MDEKKKYRYTKQLINMALRDGWTQKSIADACRTQQSVVSSWKNGSALAKESQLQKLMELYGPKLRRRTFKVYHNVFEESTGSYRIQMIKVEGEVMLSFPYRNKAFCAKCHTLAPNDTHSCRCGSKIRKVLPTRRLLVHSMGKGEFCLVNQHRLIKDECQMQFPETNIFASRVVGRYDTKSLLGHIDDMHNQNSDADEMDGTESLMLQMLARKALLEHGYPIEGIEEHVAAW